MPRVDRRKYAREISGSSLANAATHRIKIGFDRRILQPANKRGDKPMPGKLAGFLIDHNRVADDARDIDYDAMEKLGVSREQVAQALAAQIKAPPTLLPQVLRVFLVADATRGPGGFWNHDHQHNEEYRCWNKGGLFCHGDGRTAHRKRGDGGKDEIPCVPVGAHGASPEDYCPFSLKGDCRGTLEFLTVLYYLDDNGRPQPLAGREYGIGARYLYRSTAGYDPIQIVSELDDAADALDGRIQGLPALLCFRVVKRRTGKADGASVGIVGSVSLVIDKAAIAARRQQLFDQRLEDKRASLGALPPVATRQIEAPPTVEPIPAVGGEWLPPETDIPTLEAKPDHPDFDPDPGPDPGREPEPESDSDPELPEPPPEFSIPQPPEPDPNIVPLGDATPQLMVAALRRLYGDRAAQVAWFDYNGKRFQRAPEWFLDGETQRQRDDRADVLFQICQRLAADTNLDPPFAIDRQFDAWEGPKQ